MDAESYKIFKEMRKDRGLPDPEMPADVYTDSDDELEADDDDWIKGKFNSMLEIFAIVYLGKDNVEPRNQLGRIYMHSPVGIRDIYNLDNVDEEETRETIKHGDEFHVMDIKGPVPFQNDCNNLHFNLFSGVYKGNVFDVFSETRFISRDAAYLREIKLNSIDGTGEVVMLMGFYAHSTIARVEVKLNTSVATNVHGIVSATNSELDKAMATSVLFFKEQQKGISVGTDGLIPLSRSLVAVPFEADLYVDISLIVDGIPLRAIMCFSARKVGVSIKCFENLSVTVNWEALYYHSKEDFHWGFIERDYTSTSCVENADISGKHMVYKLNCEFILVLTRWRWWFFNGAPKEIQLGA